MQFKTQLVVLGAKSSKGEYNGRPFDSTTVFYQAQLQEGENFAGQVGADYKWGTSANFEKIKNQKFPFMADCVLEQVSNGKTTVTILKELTPVPQPAK
ncbi:hypothetical protein ABFY41_13135 [Acinetobacter haemolyticus]|uniref:hypothetical protein n=1 Tax=Acinetobacter haemolyticus TaxID=29430 RepID=UPI003D24E297